MKTLCILILSLATGISTLAQTRTVTNADLEKYRQQRLEAERKLKERYREMGFPSPEEIERRNAERRAAMEQYSDELRQRRLETENEIIAEANALRAQIASVEGQINYLRNNQGGSVYKGGTLSYPLGYSYGYVPFGGYGGYGGFRGFRGGVRSPLQQIRRLPPNMRTVQEYALMYPSSQSLFNQSLGNVRIGGGRIGGIGGRIGYGRRGYYRGGYVAPVIVGGDTDANGAASELGYLEQQRAGLLAQWRILEEKARRAGIKLD